MTTHIGDTFPSPDGGFPSGSAQPGAGRVAVPDGVPPPRRSLCWVPSETFVRCDRAAGHQERHSWALVARVRALEAQAPRWDAQGAIVDGP